MSQPGSGVVVPVGLTRPLARLAITGAKAMGDRDGGLVLVPGMAALLAELATSTSGPPPATIDTGMITCGEAAGRLGVTSRHVRRLAATGQLIARKHGRDWQIDADSITRRRNVA